MSSLESSKRFRDAAKENIKTFVLNNPDQNFNEVEKYYVNLAEINKPPVVYTPLDFYKEFYNLTLELNK